MGAQSDLRVNVGDVAGDRICENVVAVLLVAGVVFFLIGTEIRVRAEERLLDERFGDEFKRYKATTAAYIPFLR